VRNRAEQKEKKNTEQGGEGTGCVEGIIRKGMMTSSRGRSNRLRTRTRPNHSKNDMSMNII